MRTIAYTAALLAGAALCAPAAAHLPEVMVADLGEAPGEVLVAGVLDGQRDRVDFRQVELLVNGVPARLDGEGHYAAQVPEADYYQLRIGGPGVFAMVQTFGRREVWDERCGCLDIPAIELVARKEGRVELFFAGDTMAGRRFSDPDNGNPRLLNPATMDADLDALLAPMRPYFESADMASLNLESVLADETPGGSPPKRYTFFSPTAFAGALKRAGIDHVSLGNNHTYDYLDAGLHSTMAALDEAGMAHSGAGLDDAAALAAARVGAGETPLAMLGFVGWEGKFSPNQTASEAKGGAAHGKVENIREATRRETRAGLVPVVQYHGSAEYADRPSEYSVRRMRTAIDHGAPIVSSHHPHVTQGLELYKDGLIAYSLGNFMFDQERAETQASFVMKAWLEDGEFIRAEVIPIQVLDYRPVPAVGGMREASLRRVMELSAERGTYLQMSGGHAVVRPERRFRRPNEFLPQACEGQGELHRTSLVAATDLFCASSSSHQVGEDMLSRGDFENARYGSAIDRGWGASNAHIDFSTDARSGVIARLMPVRGDRPIYFYTQPYMRKLAPGDYTMQVRVRAATAGVLELGFKARPEQGEPASARWRGEGAGRQNYTAGDWQEINIEFRLPGNATGEPALMRPILSFTSDGNSLSPIEIDDLQIIRWGAEATEAGSRRLWTHVRLAPERSLAILSAD